MNINAMCLICHGFYIRLMMKLKVKVNDMKLLRFFSLVPKEDKLL